MNRNILLLLTMLANPALAGLDDDFSGNWQVVPDESWTESVANYVKSFGMSRHSVWWVSMTYNTLKITSVEVLKNTVQSKTEMLVTHAKTDEAHKAIEFDAAFLVGVNNHYKVVFVDRDDAEVTWSNNQSQSGSFKLKRL